MKKNVTSQFIGVQMITAADGTDFTGSITCTIAKDGAALGASAGTGPTHQATGYYEYAPTQAETNADHIAFHFVGTGAISTSVQVYTGFPQTVDNTTLLGTVDGKLDTAQTDLDTITGSDGVTLATAQALYAPNVVVPDAAGVAPTAVENRQEMDSNSTVLATIATDTTTDIPALIADVPTVAEFNARTLVATSYFDPAADAVANVTLVATTTTNTDMVGTDSAATAAALATAQSDLDIITGASGVNLLTATQASIDAIELDTGTTLPSIIDDLAIKKNATFSNFEFLMVLTSDHVTPATGITVTGQRSIDGAAFATVTGTIAEVSNGIYQFDAVAADTNGDVITWRFSSATTDDTFVTFKTVA